MHGELANLPSTFHSIPHTVQNRAGFRLVPEPESQPFRQEYQRLPFQGDQVASFFSRYTFPSCLA